MRPGPPEMVTDKLFVEFFTIAVLEKIAENEIGMVNVFPFPRKYPLKVMSLWPPTP